MSQAALPSAWLEKYQFSHDVQNLFIWRRGIFGFKLRGEIKRKQDEIQRLKVQLEQANIEYGDLTAQQTAVENRMKRLAKKSDAGSGSEADKLDLEFAQLEQKVETKTVQKTNLNLQFTKAENDLRLMISYQVNQIRTAEEAQRQWTGRERTASVDKIRDQIPPPREKKNRFKDSETETENPSDFASHAVAVSEE